MSDKKMNRWSTYEPLAAELSGKQIADLVVTGHAHSRFGERVTHEKRISKKLTYLYGRSLKTSELNLVAATNRRCLSLMMMWRWLLNLS